MTSVQDCFQEFFNANEAQAVTQTAEALFRHFNCQDVVGLQRYHILQNELKPILPFRGQRLFELLSQQIARREKLCVDREAAGLVTNKNWRSEAPIHVLVSGAGPVGLRTAVECLLLNQLVTVVEKRTIFSRVNILTTWQQTMDDLVSLGAKYFYPEQKTHGKTHMGTREIQLCLLKTVLLLGGRVFYGMEVSNIRTLPTDNTKKDTETPKFAAVCVVLDFTVIKQELDKQTNVLGFKPDKTGDYDATFKCNMMFSPDIEYDLFVSHDISKDFNEKTPTIVNGAFLLKELHKYGKDASLTSKDKKFAVFAFEFDALVLAEGEWSSTCSKLGIEKVVDKFSQAIGIVVNLEYDANNKAEKQLKEYNVSKIQGDWRNSPLKAINDTGILSENLEYLRGSTHYIVLTVEKKALIQKKVLQGEHFQPLLDSQNLDTDKLYELAREVATLVGVPQTAKFCSKNAVQIFDFSTRARCLHSHIWLKQNLNSDSDSSIDKLIKLDFEPEKDENLSKNIVQVPIFPVGDTLFEPFWPQGLGSNRGFHTAIDTAFSLLVLKQQNAVECFKERTFAYFCMHTSGWRSIGTVNKEKIWDADPMNRYVPETLIEVRNIGKVEVPDRYVNVDFKRRLINM